MQKATCSHLLAFAAFGWFLIAWLTRLKVWVISDRFLIAWTPCKTPKDQFLIDFWLLDPPVALQKHFVGIWWFRTSREKREERRKKKEEAFSFQISAFSFRLSAFRSQFNKATMLNDSMLNDSMLNDLSFQLSAFSIQLSASSFQSWARGAFRKGRGRWSLSDVDPAAPFTEEGLRGCVKETAEG